MKCAYRTPGYHFVNYILPTLLWYPQPLKQVIGLIWISSPFLESRCPVWLWNASQAKKYIKNKFLHAISTDHCMQSCWELCFPIRRHYPKSIRQCPPHDFISGAKRYNKACPGPHIGFFREAGTDRILASRVITDGGKLNLKKNTKLS